MSVQPRRHRVFKAEFKTRRRCDEYPVVLQEGRDPKVWKKDHEVKKAKKAKTQSQQGVNYLVKNYLAVLKNMEDDLNCRLVVGKQRMT
jgi:hypothetical protein